MNTVFYYHPVFLDHDTGPHPETADRLKVILSHLEEVHGDALSVVTPRRASMEEVALVHDRDYLDSVASLCRRGGGFLDGDTPVSPRSFDAALHAAGALLDGADALMEGRTRSAFALVRPPGHHARPAAGMGFCLLNNVAVAAAYLKERHKLQRLLIADFDVHHGNGTQETFYQDGSVFFLSMHRYPFYPGTGSPAERGEGAGLNRTLNLPVPLGVPPGEAVDNFEAVIHEICELHEPELILVSAGFDAYAEDPVGGLGLQATHFKALGRAVRKATDVPVLSTLEGGYSLTGLPWCLHAYVEGLG